MISQIAVALAVAFPLLFCIAICTIFLLRLRRQRTNDRFCLESLRDEHAKLEKQLTVFPKRRNGSRMDMVSSREDVRISYTELIGEVNDYIHSWIVPLLNEQSPSRTESAARIELLLFPEPPPEHFLTAGKDTRRFPNPHEYTPAEISAFLEQEGSRWMMAEHIIFSILLAGVLINGNPHQTLLPFTSSEVWALDKLRTLIQGVELHDDIPVYISNYGVYCKRPPTAKALGEVTRRDEYLQLLESLFDPYFIKNSVEDVAQRRKDSDALLDAAIHFGMTAIGTPKERMVCQWGPRIENNIVRYPQLHALLYEDGKLKYDLNLDKNKDSPMRNGEEVRSDTKSEPPPKQYLRSSAKQEPVLSISQFVRMQAVSDQVDDLDLEKNKRGPGGNSKE